MTPSRALPRSPAPERSRHPLSPQRTHRHERTRHLEPEGSSRHDGTSGTTAGTYERVVAIASWPIVAWTSYVFLGSLPYKFTNHPDTQHIFETIGGWLGGFLGTGIGDAFARFGGYAVGSAELATTLVLLAPIALWLIGKALGRRVGPSRATLHAVGGAAAALIMAGAVFFHLASPLGVVVLHEGQSDGGSLFFAAASILVLGSVLAVANGRLVGRG